MTSHRGLTCKCTTCIKQLTTATLSFHSSTPTVLHIVLKTGQCIFHALSKTSGMWGTSIPIAQKCVLHLEWVSDCMQYSLAQHTEQSLFRLFVILLAASAHCLKFNLKIIVPLPLLLKPICSVRRYPAVVNHSLSNEIKNVTLVLREYCTVLTKNGF